MAASRELSDALSKAAARIEKEIERYERAPATMRVGGITQIAKALETVMKAALREICDAERLDPEAVVLQNTDARSLARASLGQLAHAVKDVPSRRRVVVPSLRRELGQRRSAFWEFLNIRNQAVVHAGGKIEPTPQIMLPILRDLLRVMKATINDCERA